MLVLVTRKLEVTNCCDSKRGCVEVGLRYLPLAAFLRLIFVKMRLKLLLLILLSFLLPLYVCCTQFGSYLG